MQNSTKKEDLISVKSRDEIIASSIEWYLSNKLLFKQLSNKVQIIINELLEINNISIHAIFNRVKEIESFKAKINDSKYTNPEEQITDLAGIRVICYVESDISKICKVIESNFEIDLENSIDKSKLLGVDKVGYKSVHYVASLNAVRLQLPEYQNYKNKKFEIQIRTILQHAWAEIEHDRNYKFSGELPEEIKRRFKLVAGSLELADIEFDRLAHDIDSLVSEVEKGTKEGNLDFEINSTTLKQFLFTKFEEFIPEKINPTFNTNENEIKALDELKKFGVTNLNQLNDIIPIDFTEALNEFGDRTTFFGLLRLIMIANNWEKYFQDSYLNKFSIGSLETNDIMRHYEIPFDKVKSLIK